MRCDWTAQVTAYVCLDRVNACIAGTSVAANLGLKDLSNNFQFAQQRAPLTLVSLSASSRTGRKDPALRYGSVCFGRVKAKKLITRAVVGKAGKKKSR